MDLLQAWHDVRYTITVHFDSTLVDLDLDSSSQSARKQTLLCQLSQKVFNLNGM